MKLEYVRHVGGPNRFTTAPVAIARLELQELTCKETVEFPGFTERLVMSLPGLRDHYCAAGMPGGFVAALERGTYFGHVTEHVALELSGLAGRHVHLGRTMWSGADGRYDVMMECPVDEPEDSGVPEALFHLALVVVQDLLAWRRPGYEAGLAEIARTAERERFGPSSAAIAATARGRGIPVRRVGELSMLRLGYGCHRRLVSAALTEQTSVLGVDIAGDKMLAKRMLAVAGIEVPQGRIATSAADAARAFTELGPPVVLKPRSGNHGSFVTIGVCAPAEAEEAYLLAAAGSGSKEVIVETFIPGTDFRVLVIGGKVAAAAELRPPSVTGDGTKTIAQLVAEVNTDPRRGHGHSRVLTMITLDEAALLHLAATGLTPDSVPAAGERVQLRRNGNLSTGGTSVDVTDIMHPQVTDLCQRAANAAGLDICGVDIRLADVSAPLRAGDHDQDPEGGKGSWQAGAVIEINACPGLRMHLSPAEGTPRDVAGAIVDRLYPPGAQSRIPIAAVTGTNGKTTTVRMIAHILRTAGLRTGVTSTDGVLIGGMLVHEADASGPRSAEIVLDDPTVEAAVLETARGGIVRRGLGYDQADVAVITNITADHLGDDNVDDLGELTEVKALVAEQLRDGGSLVLNGADPLVAGFADRPRVREHAPVVRYFSVVPGVPVMERHKRAGGTCYELLSGQLTETGEGRQRLIMDVADLPGAFGGRAPHVVANALAAIAASRALGVTIRDIRDALMSFAPAAANPGRGNLYTAGASPVILDYGHNAAALRTTGEMIRSIWDGEPAVALTLPGDRRDDLIAESADAIASWCGAVVIYEDEDKRGRPPGEMRAIIASALRQIRPEIKIEHAEGPQHALRSAVTLAAGGPVLFVYEKLSLATGALAALEARPWPDHDIASPDTVLDELAEELGDEFCRSGADLASQPGGFPPGT